MSIAQIQLPTLEQIYEIRKLFTQAYYISDFFMTFMEHMSRKCRSKFGSKLEHWNGFNVDDKNFTLVLSSEATATEIDEKLISIYRDFLLVCRENPDLHRVLFAINPEACSMFTSLLDDVKKGIRPRVTVEFLAQNMINILHIGGEAGNVCRVNLI